MKVKMVNKLIGVVQDGTHSKKVDSLGLAEAEPTRNLGTIKYMDETIEDSPLKEGMKVYFGDNRQRVRMKGVDIEVMKEDNIIAIAED